MAEVFSTMGPDGVATLVPPFTSHVNSYELDGTNPVTVTWPAGMDVANIVAPLGNLWVRSGGAAAIPSGTVTDGTASASGVAQRRRVTGVSTFSIISSAAQIVTIEFWSGRPE